MTKGSMTKSFLILIVAGMVVGCNSQESRPMGTRIPQGLVAKGYISIGDKNGLITRILLDDDKHANITFIEYTQEPDLKWK